MPLLETNRNEEDGIFTVSVAVCLPGASSPMRLQPLARLQRPCMRAIPTPPAASLLPHFYVTCSLFGSAAVGASSLTESMKPMRMLCTTFCCVRHPSAWVGQTGCAFPAAPCTIAPPMRTGVSTSFLSASCIRPSAECTSCRSAHLHIALLGRPAVPAVKEAIDAGLDPGDLHLRILNGPPM